MAYSARPLPSHLRQPSTAGGSSISIPSAASSTGQSQVLLARINEKKLELENLRQLKDLSAGLAGQMSVLEEKLATLADGTEAVALVLSNWHNVLRAISMASTKIPKPKDQEEEKQDEDSEEVPLPQTLVRIPTKDAPKLEQVNSAGSAARGGGGAVGD